MGTESRPSPIKFTVTLSCNGQCKYQLTVTEDRTPLELAVNGPPAVYIPPVVIEVALIWHPCDREYSQPFFPFVCVYEVFTAQECPECDLNLRQMNQMSVRYVGC